MLDFIKYWGKAQCHKCGKWDKKKEMKRFVVAEDALGPMMIEWYHPKCFKKTQEIYVSLGKSMYLGTYGFGGRIY